MRRTLIVSLLFFCFFISSCDRVGGDSLSNSKALPSELMKPALKMIDGVEFGCMVGEPASELAGLYVINGRNTTGRKLKKVTAHLLLLNSKNGDFLRLSTNLEDIPVNKDIHVEWKLPSSSTIGAYWQKSQRTFSSARERAYYGFKPSNLIFISTPEGVYEINSKNITFYFPLSDGNYEATERNLVDGTGREGFKHYNIALPGD